MAWAKLGVSHGYVVQEAQAASRFLGVHNHHCEQPDIWRSKNQQFQRGEGSGAQGRSGGCKSKPPTRGPPLLFELVGMRGFKPPGAPAAAMRLKIMERLSIYDTRVR